MAKISLPLSNEGAVVEVLIGVAARHAKQMQESGSAVPIPIQTLAVIDTGAQLTCADAPLPQHFGLTAHDDVTLTSAAGNVTCYRFEVSLSILHASLPRGKRRIAKALPVVQVEVDPSLPAKLWIGLDVLQHCDFCYRGKKGLFTLDF